MSVNYFLLGRRIRETRIALRITQSELAEMTDLSEQYISNIECARRKLSLPSLIRIADALGVTADSLLAGNLSHNPSEYNSEIIKIFSECSPQERRFLYELMSAVINAIHSNNWDIST